MAAVGPVSDDGPSSSMRTASRVREILDAGLDSVSARACVERALDEAATREWLAEVGGRPLDLIAVGKASTPMTHEFLAHDDRPSVSRTLVVSPVDAASGPGLDHREASLEHFVSEHPLPGPGGERAAAVVEEWAADGAGRDLVFLLSGGASSLLPAPAAGFTLAEKVAWSDRLMRAGADIHQLNTVRRQMSRFKGGRLAACSRYERVLVLVISDVVGDDLAVVGSGPWHRVGSSTSASQEAALIVRRLLGEDAGELAVRLARSPDPPPSDSPCFARIQHVICGSGATALDAMQRAATEGLEGVNIESWGAGVVGEAREVACRLVRSAVDAIRREEPRRGSRFASSMEPSTSWFGLGAGETTVTVRGDGLGGRNQELALAFALEWERLVTAEDMRRFTFASLGSDGRDGPTPAAGAMVDHFTLGRMRAAGLDPAVALDRNDSYHALHAVGATIVTGPTGTNVGDLMVCGVESSRD